MAKFKMGDWFKWKNDPLYSGKIRSIQKGRYFYEIYYEGVFKEENDYPVIGLEKRIRPFTKLDKVLL